MGSISRRTVLGAAWATPVLVVSTAAPAAAASPTPSLLPAYATPYEDQGARKWYAFWVDNPTQAPLTVTLTLDDTWIAAQSLGEWEYVDTVDYTSYLRVSLGPGQSVQNPLLEGYEAPAGSTIRAVAYADAPGFLTTPIEFDVAF